MVVLWRILGLQLLAELGAQLPARYARLLSVGFLVLANVVPVVGVWQGWMSLGDVFVVYWLENVIVWFFAIIRIATAQRPTTVTTKGGAAWTGAGLAVFFCFHYGIFTLVHGVFTAVLVGLSGGFENAASWAWAALALFVSHLLSLVIHWFGRGERSSTSPGQAMAWPYPRMIVMHVAILGSFFLVLRNVADDGAASPLLPVLLLIGLKVAVDTGLHLAERARAARQAPARDDLAFHPQAG